MATKSTGKTKKRVYDRSRGKEFRHHFVFESYGVKIRVTSNEAEAIEEIRTAVRRTFSNCFAELEDAAADHTFLLARNASGKDSLYRNSVKLVSRLPRQYVLDTLGAQIRLTVAEHAADFVFVHAGVVVWDDGAMLIPGRSFRGKSTLTAALVRLGAVYYSDEYAVLDSDGLVHPFAKPISIRGAIDAFTQTDYTLEELGGIAGTDRKPVKMVLITEYRPNGRWKPRRLTAANGIIELIKNAIPIRNKPATSLNVFNQLAKSAVFIKSPRGDVSESADLILQLFEQQSNKSER